VRAVSDSLDYQIDLVAFTRVCRLEADTVTYLVEAGVLEPLGATRAQWQFSAQAIRRGRMASRLMRDLELEEGSVALVMELLEDRERLRRRLAALESLLEDAP